MKKAGIYIVAALAFAALCFLLVLNAKQQPKKLDEHITLRQQDKIPYGTYAAQALLPGLFPSATITTDAYSSGFLQTVSEKENDQALIFVSKYFNASDRELNKLLSFVKKGNYVFIIAKSLSFQSNRFFHCTDNSESLDDYYGTEEDSLRIGLEKPPFALANAYIYPGKRYENYFSSIDTATTIILGRTQDHRANFIQLNAGKGSIYIHLAPLAFSNYFILHKDNIHYFQKALSVIPAGIRKVTWSEYYLNKPMHHKAPKPGLFHVLFQYPSFKWAFLMAIALLLLYVAMEVRRKQRIIPAWQKPANESLDFIKTIGRLYYEKSDHQNLAQKMSAYFLDHIRSRYKMPTQHLDEPFVALLHAKSGYDKTALQSIITFINEAKENDITDEQLFDFHKQLELFYQNT